MTTIVILPWFAYLVNFTIVSYSVISVWIDWNKFVYVFIFQAENLKIKAKNWNFLKENRGHFEN